MMWSVFLEDEILQVNTEQLCLLVTQGKIMFHHLIKSEDSDLKYPFFKVFKDFSEDDKNIFYSSLVSDSYTQVLKPSLESIKTIKKEQKKEEKPFLINHLKIEDKPMLVSALPDIIHSKRKSPFFYIEEIYRLLLFAGMILGAIGLVLIFRKLRR